MIAAGLFFKAIGTGIWGFVSKIPLKVWAVIAVLVAVWFYGGYKERVGVAKQAVVTAKVQGHLDADRAVAKAYREEVKKAISIRLAANARKERADAAAFKLAADNLKVQNEKSQREASRTIADLRSGALKLRERFQCKASPAAGSGSEVAAGTAGGDDPSNAGLQKEDAGFLISESDRADQVVNQLNACQDILEAERSPIEE